MSYEKNKAIVIITDENTDTCTIVGNIHNDLKYEKLDGSSVTDQDIEQGLCKKRYFLGSSFAVQACTDFNTQVTAFEKI